MVIRSATFTISSPSLSLCPSDGRPEYAFIGRSNVGKSSLINMLCAQRSLAKTSSTPGKTLLINHFLINNSWYLVDLPGYGFAQRSKSTQAAIQTMISDYILRRNELLCLFVLIDIRHPQQKIDRTFVDWLGENGIPFALVFTKADKLSTTQSKTNAAQWLAALSDTWETLPPHFITSSTTTLGRDELLTFISRHL